MGPVLKHLAVGLPVTLSLGGRASAQSGRLEWPVIESAGRLPRIDLRRDPDLRIGTAMGPEETTFSGIAGLTRLRDGEIVVADAGNYRVLFFDGRGRAVRVIGRKGSGPGEFGQIRWLGPCANGRIGVQDGARGVLSVFSPDGKYERSDPFPPEVHFDQVLWCSGAGELLMLLDRPRLPHVEPGQHLAAETTLLQVRDGRPDTLWHPGPQDFYVGQRVAAYGPVPLARRVLASGAGGMVFVCTNQDAQCAGWDAAHQAAPPKRFSVALARRRLAEGDWDRVLAAYASRDPDREVQKRLAALAREFEPRREFPLIDEVQADRNANLWVRTHDSYATPWATWVVVAADGTPQALVALPRALDLAEIGADYLLGSTRDQDGVERVELYRFEPFVAARGAARRP